MCLFLLIRYSVYILRSEVSLLGRECKCENVTFDLKREESSTTCCSLEEFQSRDAEQPDALLPGVTVGQGAGEGRKIEGSKAAFLRGEVVRCV